VAQTRQEREGDDKTKAYEERTGVGHASGAPHEKMAPKISK